MSLSQSSEINLTDNGKLALNAKKMAESAQSAANNAYDMANGAQRTADGKNSVYRGADPNTVPTTELKDGDIYFTDNALYTWNGSSWEETVSDTTGEEIRAKVDKAIEESQKDSEAIKANIKDQVKKLDEEIQNTNIKTGNALNFYKEQYYLSTSYTELTGGSWSDDVPTKTEGKYVWSRYVTANVGAPDNQQYSDPVCISGLDGAQGPQGPSGPQGPQGVAGPKGTDGKTTYVHVAYANSADGNTNFNIDYFANALYIGVLTDYTQEDSTDYTKYTWSRLKGDDGDQGVPGPKGSNGQTTYVHFAYANSDDGKTNFNVNYFSNALYIGTYTDYNQTDSGDYTKYTWSRLKGDTGATGATGAQGPRGLQGLQGPKGDQGIQGITGATGPQGPQGESSYTHIAYATSADGKSGFDVSNGEGKTYIGIYVDSDPTDSTNPAKYAWSLIKGADGAQGIQGPKGADGRTPYFHIAYANSSDGTVGFDVSNSVGKLYIGQYTDYAQTDSSNPASYSWTRIKGETGQTGATGPQGPIGPQGPKGETGQVGPQGPQGVAGAKGTDGRTTYVHVAYANSADGKSNFSVNYFDNALYVGVLTDYTEADSTDYTKYTWSRLKGDTGATGPQGLDGSSFKTFTTNYTYDQNGIDTYSKSGYSGVWLVNESTSELKIGDTVQLRITNSSKAGYSFIIAQVTAIPDDKSITCVSSGVIDKGDIGPKGATGATGAQGAKGEDGKSPQPNLARYNCLWASSAKSINYDSATNTYTIVNNTPNSSWGSAVSIRSDSYNKVLVPFGSQYVASAEIYTPVAMDMVIDFNNGPASGGAWAGNDNDDVGSRQTYNMSVPANVWTRIAWTTKNTSSNNTNKVDLIIVDSIGSKAPADTTWKLRNFKVELGNTATPWVPNERDLIGPKGDTGNQGIQGPKGDNGQTTYVHFAYANSADGKTNFNVSYFDNALYVGTYTDYTQTDSNDYTKYTWSRLKGDIGTSFKLFTTNYTYNQNEINSYSNSGYSVTWAVNESTSDLRVGDTVQLRLMNSSKAGYSFVIAKVTAIPNDKAITCMSSGLVDKGDTGQTGPTGAKGTDGTDAATISVKSYTYSAANGARADIELTGPNAFKQTVKGRGHNIWVLDVATHKLKEFVNCDTYSTMSFSHNGTSTWIANYLSGLTDSIVVIAAGDANAVDQNLRNVLNQMGGSPELGTWGAGRVGHTFIGMSKRSDGSWPLQPRQGYEEAVHTDGSAPEIGCALTNSGIVFNGAKGDQGATGATGPKGDKGDTGSTGFFIGNTPPPNPAVGTVWATKDSSGNMTSAKTWNGSSWVSTAFTQDLVAGNITASKIVGGELDVNKITIKNAQNIPIEGTVSLGKKLSDMKQDADGLLLTVKNDGQNLLRDTDTIPFWGGATEKVDNFKVIKATKTWTGGDGYDPIAWNGLTCIKPNTDYTLTFYAKADQNNVLIYSYLYNIGTNSVYKDGSTANRLTTSYQRYEIHFHTEDFSDGRTVNCLPMRIIDANVACYIYGIQLEEGTIATAWSPSPGDISALKITSSSLDAYINGSQGSSTLKALLHMDPNNSSIAQLVNGNPVAAINLSKEGKVQIDGSHISLNSATTIPDATIKSGMIESLSADKLTAGTIDASQIRVINLDANNITTGTLSARIEDLRKFNTYVVSSSNTWDFNYTKSTYGNWFLIGETNINHVWNGPGITPYMYVTCRGTKEANGSDRYVVTVWKDNDPTQYQRVWNGGSWSQWVKLPNSQNIVSTINLSKEGVKISGKNIELDGNTTVTGRLDLMQKNTNWVSQSTNYHNNWNWNNAHIYFDNYLQLLGENCNVHYTNTNTTLNGGRTFYSITTLTPGYLKFTTYQNKVSTTDENFDGQITRSYLDSGRLETPEVYTDKFVITGHHIRVRDNRFLMVTNKNGTNFDNSGSVGFQVWGGIALGKNTIGAPSNDLYFQRGNIDAILDQSYSDAPKLTLHADHIASQSANTVTSRLSTKTDITKVTYDRALAAVEGTEMYDYRYISDDSGQHYVSGIIDDVNTDPQYHMDGMLINKERTARIDANLVGYHHVVIQKLLERINTLEANNKNLLDRVATLEKNK